MSMQILVFKTNLTDTKRISDVEVSLDIHPNIIGWNVDLNDSDNILRIVSNNIAAAEVESMLLSAGYYCEELQ
ncbi:MAG: copper chaperone [Ferruginibacter sp.]